jgi:hypothetical protein
MNAFPSIPAGYVEVQREQFFALLACLDWRREFKPDGEYFTTAGRDPVGFSPEHDGRCYVAPGFIERTQCQPR